MIIIFKNIWLNNNYPINAQCLKTSQSFKVVDNFLLLLKKHRILIAIIKYNDRKINNLTDIINNETNIRECKNYFNFWHI